MNAGRRALGVFLAVWLGSGCRISPTGPAARTLEGSVTYLVRRALPPDAAVTARLSDVTLRDVAPLVVAQERIESPGQVPIAFSLEIPEERFDPSHDYVFTAEIRDAGGGLLFATPEPIPVVTRGKPASLVAVLQPTH